MLAFFRVKLRAEKIVARDGGGDRLAVMGGCSDVVGVSGRVGIGVYEISVGVVAEIGQDWVGIFGEDVVPAHVGDREALTGADLGDLSRHPVEAGRVTIFAANARHELHAHADTKERHGAFQNGCFERVNKAGLGAQIGGAIGKMTHAGQDDPVRCGDVDGVCCDGDIMGCVGAAGRFP